MTDNAYLEGVSVPERMSTGRQAGTTDRGGAAAAERLARAERATLLLDLDPDLGAGIGPEEWEPARRATHVRRARIGPGEWTVPQRVAASQDVVGLIILEGLIARELALVDHHILELLGRGDVLLLPTPASEVPRVGGEVVLTALTETRLIVLGAPFVRAAARWPNLLINLHRRLEAQRQRLAIQGLAAHLPRAEDRLLLTLSLLADVCGRVTPQGAVLPIALRHEDLAKLSAARRPTISLALRRLEESGCIRRRHNGRIILTDAARRRIEEIAAAGDGAPGLARRLSVSPPRAGQAGSAISTAPKPGSGPSMKKISMVISGST